MTVTRRTVTAWLLASSAAACSGGGGAQVTQAPMRPVPNAGYDAWIASFRGRALGQGISATTLDRALQEAGFLPDVIERTATRPSSPARSRITSPSPPRTSACRRAARALPAMAAMLTEIEARYGVEPQTSSPRSGGWKASTASGGATST